VTVRLAMGMTAMASVHEEVNPDTESENTGEQIVVAWNVSSMLEEQQETRNGEKQDQAKSKSRFDKRSLIGCTGVRHICPFDARGRAKAGGS
tara:strand:+ start:1297 stop:1572 length:276 start_codon:yes stop_codon:yes gene_type:complete